MRVAQEGRQLRRRQLVGEVICQGNAIEVGLFGAVNVGNEVAGGAADADKCQPAFPVVSGRAPVGQLACN